MRARNIIIIHWEGGLGCVGDIYIHYTYMMTSNIIIIHTLCRWFQIKVKLGFTTFLLNQHY